ncbi:Ubiquitin carboxyl-terminal hydrolase family member protein [Theileria equi strain WA]|uniref:Ubiquitin carboxyl-terminal hydrolase family member protein n=1 Tax=Theileria equi strain WA TaxID=1537102 RepID=L1LBW7_THEEQ|nr:Ubiquitin carboxyl-terminal hydrolase family member protein [Theileria equi strain WA]EKX72673.1 Ubiquitin carboxyl-terminal hydrolase family member protein [Theileria equi strain WA]|eukprot:XP_004832125.1 Ubiquitin carboxyl-terminal hydrolase family member protein [Theileria equi strain WA]
MHWFNGTSQSSDHQSNDIPPVQQNEVDLIVHNFKENFILPLTQYIESGEGQDKIKELHAISIYSEWKELPNFLFRIMFFPVCPHSEGGTSLSQFKISAYVEAKRKGDWPENWVCYGTRFCIFVVNHKELSSTIFKKDSFNFSKTETDRGWQGILSHLQVLENGFLNEAGDLVIRAGVYPVGAEVDRSSRDSSYNCREATGFVGLQNHGATCYMNALLQSLYSITKFRKAVYKLSFRPDEMIGTKSYEIIKRLESNTYNNAANSKNNKRKSNYSHEYEDSAHSNMDIDEDLDEKDCCTLLFEEEEEKRKVPCVGLALQNLFYNLKYAEDSPPCKELMKSFGWDSSDMFTQQDSHELLKLLLDKMEEQMKGTPVEGSVKNIFEGEMETYIECIDIEFKSSRKETFEDIQLDVQGCDNIYDSLKKLTEPELLSGDNMYEAKGHGKQRANKGIRFLKFPPVCLFLLKRFTFDLQRMDTVKLNSRFEFYKTIDLSTFCPNAGEYVLQAVSVHHGSINSGHYYAFTASDKGEWFRFDDEIVSKVSEYAVIGDNFGGEEPDCQNYFTSENNPYKSYRRPKAYNAYILIYVLKSAVDEILGDCDPIKENFQMIERCKYQEKVSETRARIKERLNKFIKIRVFERGDFENCRFLDQPFMEWTAGKILTFDKNTPTTDALLSIAQNLNQNLSSDKRLLSNFHIMGLNRQVNRFYCLSDIKTRAKITTDTLQELAELICKEFFQVYDPTLYILFVPRTLPNVLPEAHSLFVIKYFDIFSSEHSDENLICIDLVYLSPERRISQISKSVLERLIKLMESGMIASYRVGDLKRCVNHIERGVELNDEDSSIERIMQEESLHLCWYLELANNYETLAPQKVLGDQQLSNGDILICNFRPTEEMMKEMNEKENKFGLKEDFEATQPTLTASSKINPIFFFSQKYLDSINLNFRDVCVYASEFGDMREKWQSSSIREKIVSENIFNFPIYDFPSFIDCKLNKVRVKFKLYFPLESLATWVNCSNASVTDFSPVQKMGEATPEDRMNDCVVKTMDIEVDLRTPCKHVLRYVCWSMDVDPSHVLVYGSPPHLSESIGAYSFSIDDFCHRDHSLGYVQKPLSELFSKLGTIVDTRSGSDYDYDGNSSNDELAENKYGENLICISVLPEPYLEWNKKVDGDVLNFVGQIFNEKVEIVASVMGKISANSNVRDLCNIINSSFQMYTSKKFILIDCLNSVFDIVDPETQLVELPQYKNASVRNLFAAPLRFSPDWTSEEYKLIERRDCLPLTVIHQTPDHEYFGHPFQILVSPNWTLGEIKSAIKGKIDIQKKEWDRWTFYQLVDGHTRTWKSNDDKLDWEANDIKLLAEHPKPYEKSRNYGVMKIS